MSTTNRAAVHRAEDDSAGDARPVDRPRRAVRVALLGLACVAVLALLDAAWSSLSVARGLSAARAHMELGKQALLDGRIDDAAHAFRLAENDSVRASSYASHPTLAIASVLPLAGDDVRAVRLLARTSRIVAGAGAALARSGAAEGWTGGGAPGIERGGRIDLGLLEEAAPSIRAAQRRISAAGAALAPLPTDGLFGPVASAVATAKRRLTEAESALADADRLTQLLPGFLGESEVRRYFLAFQNLSDPRGTGGYIGTYGILRADHGHVSLGGLRGTADLQPVPAVPASRAYRNLYARFGGTRYPKAANYSPDFPQTARVLLRMWKAGGHRPLDGVVFVDPVWVAGVLGAVGPVQVPDWPEPLTADNVSRVLLRDAFDFPVNEIDQSNALQARLAEGIWQAVLTRPLAGAPFADAMASATRERHLLVYSAHPSEERLLDRVGASGRLRLGRNPLFVTWDGATPARTGYFLRQLTGYIVHLRADGSARVDVAIIGHNEAPAGAEPSVLMSGSEHSDPPGFFAGYTNAFLPSDARGIEWRTEHTPTAVVFGRDLGHRVVMNYVQMNPGTRAIVRLSYTVPHAAERDGDRLEYRARLLVQTGLRAPYDVVEVHVPAGTRVVSAAPGMRVRGAVATYRAVTHSDQSIWVGYAA